MLYKRKKSNVYFNICNSIIYRCIPFLFLFVVSQNVIVFALNVVGFVPLLNVINK